MIIVLYVGVPRDIFDPSLTPIKGSFRAETLSCILTF